MSRVARAFALALFVVIAVQALAVPSTDKIGHKIDLPITDADGRVQSPPVARATVIVFLSFDCPVSNSYIEPLNELARTFAPQGVSFLGFCPTSVPAEEVAKQVKEYALTFPVYRDHKLLAVDALKAASTPEAFVLDKNSVLRYRGRIDNGYAARLKKNAHVTERDLKDALEDVLAGRPVRTPATAPIGCAIARVKPVAISNAAVTYHRDVQPVLQAHCQSCHRPGAVGPFSLMTYGQAVNWATDIKEYAQARKMPPWKPVEVLPTTHDRRLPEKDIATLVKWVDLGMPQGDPQDAPPPATFSDGWHLGQPDLVLTVPAEFVVGPSGADLFRVFVLPTGLMEDKFVTAYEVKPGNARVVHHTLNFIDTAGAARELEAQEKSKPLEGEYDRGPGYSVRMGVGIRPRGAVGGWAPGQVPTYLPEGTGYFLPKNSDLVLQVHYHRTGKVEKDKTSVGLYFAKKPVEKAMQGLAVGLANPLDLLTFAIPAGNDHFVVKRSLWTAEDCTLYSVLPHMHLIGRSVKLTMTPPQGATKSLIAIADWDYNWQETYYFKEPLRVPAGTRFDIEAVYDNSTKNLNNPNDPPKPVRFGEQTTNEMCFGFLGVTGDKPGAVHFYIDEGRKVLLPPKRLTEKK
ncbi:MAG: redoxin domain-containing protein [Gemmataceae bacterium]